MVDESDGIGEAFDGQIRIALAAAMQLAQHIARLREELARNSQAHTEQQTRELQVRFDAERDAARASLAPVELPGWWDRASVTEIADAYETTEAWTHLDPHMARVGDQMRNELSSRYGVDVNNLGADPTAVRDAISRTEQARAEAARARGESRQEYAEAAIFLTAADQLDSRDRALQYAGQEDDLGTPAEGFRTEEIVAETDAVRDEGIGTYDSAERRSSFAAEMENKNIDADLQKVRLAADRENAAHPTAAVTMKPGRAGKARSRSQTPSMTRERGGVTR